jgi:hypothetical protein
MTPQDTLPKKLNGLGVLRKKISKAGKSQLEKEKSRNGASSGSLHEEEKSNLGASPEASCNSGCCHARCSGHGEASSEEEINEKMKKTGITKPPLQFAHGAT